MASAKAASEPSMEEILASIRQIIADEDSSDSEAEKVNDQTAIDDAFANIDVGEEMSTDDVDALFDAPAGAPEEENDQAAINAAFDNIDVDDEDEMSTDDVDALFDTPVTSEDDDDDDVLALSVDQTIDSNDGDEEDISFDMDDDVVPAPVAPTTLPPVSQKAAAPASMKSGEQLLSNDAASSVRSSFGALNSAMTMSSTNTVEDLMKSMMRPMLKQWLDENLPETVERLVQAEIERMRNQ